MRWAPQARSWPARVFFEDNSLRETALKLARLIEGAASPSRPYFEALGGKHEKAVFG